MNKILAILLALFTLAASAQTEEPAAAGQFSIPNSRPLRIGYLSYDSALVRMADYAAVQQQMAALRSAYEAEMQRVEDEFNQKYEAFLEGQKDFPRTILLKRQTELQTLLQRNVDFRRQAQTELQQAERQAMQPLHQRLTEAIARVAAHQGLAVVLNTDSRACPFVDPALSVDVSQAVNDLLR
ncbi:MAG: OmpH family outer membrane protein [Prevotella sp.]|nr:OmpH family outer membrane protein [Prevotella sp.]